MWINGRLFVDGEVGVFFVQGEEVKLVTGNHYLFRKNSGEWGVGQYDDVVGAFGPKPYLVYTEDVNEVYGIPSEGIRCCGLLYAPNSGGMLDS